MFIFVFVRFFDYIYIIIKRANDEKKTAEFIFKKLKNEIFSPILKHDFRVSEKDFSRNRKQSFSTVLLLMMNLLRKSLAIEIDGFVNFIYRKNTSPKPFTQSAFVQARKKIKPSVFKKLLELLHLSGQ